MPKYLCIRRSQPGQSDQAQRGPMPSPAQMEEMYARFNAWRERFQANIVDLGGKLTETARVVTPDGVSDGPFVEVKEVVGGYMILSAETIDEAIEVARQCPGVIAPGASLEVREFAAP